MAVLFWVYIATKPQLPGQLVITRDEAKVGSAFGFCKWEVESLEELIDRIFDTFRWRWNAVVSVNRSFRRPL